MCERRLETGSGPDQVRRSGQMAPAKDQLTQKGQKESSLWRSAFLLQESDSISLCQFRQTGNSAALHNSQRQPDASASPAPAEAPPPPERVGSRYPHRFRGLLVVHLFRAVPRGPASFPLCLSLHLAAAGLLIGPACAMAQTGAGGAPAPAARRSGPRCSRCRSTATSSPTWISGVAPPRPRSSSAVTRSRSSATAPWAICSSACRG
jgi:hypothetical protein